MVQRVFEGATVVVQGYEFTATNVEWFDEADRFSGAAKGRRCVRFVGVCTDNPCNDDIRHTGYNRGVYGGNDLAGYVEYKDGDAVCAQHARLNCGLAPCEP